MGYLLHSNITVETVISIKIKPELLHVCVLIYVYFVVCGKKILNHKPYTLYLIQYTFI